MSEQVAERETDYSMIFAGVVALIAGCVGILAVSVMPSVVGAVMIAIIIPSIVGVVIEMRRYVSKMTLLLLSSFIAFGGFVLLQILPFGSTGCT